ncbi:DNA-binding response OmpR family regulator [Elusimicrobium simillimum]|uniref:response regulator transcription factor n=1 Tax=Elusimicrobium simillimum TaxID=3143438 RepID=UPI003C6F31A1
MKKILIIEDEPSISEMVKMMLERSGFEAVICDNGREALDVVKRENPNLIILDVMLPGMDGIEIAKALNNSSDTANIPIIVASALEESKHLFEGISQVKGFAAKPFTIQQLLENVNKYIA